MIFLKLFIVFSYIGLFNFGGGYAMLSFIQKEVVQDRGWLDEQEFTDIVAISQMTPGPIGINCATYTGYTAVMNDQQLQTLCGGAEAPAMYVMGTLGSILATLSVVWLPFMVMIWVSKLILKHKDSQRMKGMFGMLKPAVIGLLASAALALMNTANFGSWQVTSPADSLNVSLADQYQLVISIVAFLIVLCGVWHFKWNIIYTTMGCAVAGILIYGF